MKTAFLGDEITTFIKDHDSSWALMKAAYKKGYQVFYAKSDTLIEEEQVRASFVMLDKEFFDYQEINQAKLLEFPGKYQSQELELDDFDYCFMRKDPPVDEEYIRQAKLLERCQKVKVLNNPSSLININEKLSILNFPKLIVETIVTDSKQEILSFVNSMQKAILKPLDGMGGKGIELLEKEAAGLEAIIDAGLQANGKVMVQKYIPDIKSQGDKRLIVINGECIGALLRVTPEDSFKANLAAGGSYQKYELKQRDLEIVSSVKDFLLENGIFFAGLDVIGDYLTEINITSPTCLQEINEVNNLSFEKSMEKQILDTLAMLQQSPQP